MIRDAIAQSKAIHRSILEQIYDGLCTVYVQKQVKNLDTRVMESFEQKVLEDQPCHMVITSSPAASSTGTVTDAPQEIRLLLAPEVDIPAGSKIVVTQRGRTGEYCQSGQPVVLETHQEILLKLFGGYA